MSTARLRERGVYFTTLNNTLVTTQANVIGKAPVQNGLNMLALALTASTKSSHFSPPDVTAPAALPFL